MSYDIYAIPVSPGQSPKQAADAFFAAEEEGAHADDPLNQRRRELADALRAADSSLYHGEERNGTGPQQCLSLHGPELEISLYAGHAVITWPYWESLDQDALTARLAVALRTLRDHAGYVAWDPQLDATLDPEGSLAEVRAGHERGVRSVNEFVARENAEADASAQGSEPGPGPQRPWWRRIF